MGSFLASFVIGVVCVVIGMFNRKGNISMLHSYHRARVSQEEVIPFGKQVGLGMIVVGCAIMIFSVLSAVTVFVEQGIFAVVGTVMLIAGLAVGLGISFHAMMKYNKGII